MSADHNVKLGVPGFESDELEPPDVHRAQRRLERRARLHEGLDVMVTVALIVALVFVTWNGRDQAARADKLASALDRQAGTNARVAAFQVESNDRFAKLLADLSSAPAEARPALIEQYRQEQAAAEAHAREQGVPLPSRVTTTTRARSPTTTGRPTPTTARPSPPATPCTVASVTVPCAPTVP